MKQKLPSAHQHGDVVNLNLFDAGRINNCKITKISFDPGKVFYDVEIEVKPGMVTRLRMISSSFLEKVVYQYAFKIDSNHPFIFDQEYFAYEDQLMTLVGHTGGDNPLIKYIGYNYLHGVAIFESTWRLNKEITHYVPVYMGNDQAHRIVFNVNWIDHPNGELFIPDHLNEPMPVKAELTESDKEHLPRFSIKDIDKIFDDERRNHGTNPIDSINRMYRKLLALKEKGV